MRIEILAGILISIASSVVADLGMRGIGELPINSEASWGNNPLTDNTNYRMGSTSGITTGTVSSADNFTLMGAPGNLLLAGDIANARAVIKVDGGTMQLAGGLRLGAHSSGEGHLRMSGGNLSIVSALEVARYNDGAHGSVEIDGGTLNVQGNLLLGNASLAGEDASFTVAGGNVNVGGQFQLQDGQLNFKLGSNAIQCNQRTGGDGIIALLFDAGYSHLGGTTNLIISSEAQSGVFTLSTDFGDVLMNNGAEVTVNGYEFEVLRMDGAGGALGVIAIPEPATLGFLITSGLGLMIVRRFQI